MYLSVLIWVTNFSTFSKPISYSDLGKTSHESKRTNDHPRSLVADSVVLNPNFHNSNKAS